MSPSGITYPLPRDALRRAGEYLYGERWQSALARDLHVAPHTVGNWMADPSQPRHREIPGPAVAAIRLLVERKQLRELVG